MEQVIRCCFFCGGTCLGPSGASCLIGWRIIFRVMLHKTRNYLKNALQKALLQFTKMAMKYSDVFPSRWENLAPS